MNFKKQVTNYIGYIMPLVLIILIYLTDSNYSIYDFLAIFILVYIFIIVSSLRLNKPIEIILNLISVSFFNILCYIVIAHYHIFKSNLKSSTFFVIFDSNFGEAGEFLSMYLDSYLILVFLIFILGILIQIIINYYRTKNIKNNSIKLILLIPPILLLASYKIRSHTLPYLFISSYKNYVLEKNKLNKIYIDKKGGEFTNVVHNEIQNKELYILIIGESTTRNKMSLYNYYRKTNPKLNTIIDELVVYNDVISPHTHTITSLEKVLTLANAENPNKKFNGNILQLFNRAGFETFWISNQNPLGLYETQTTIFSKSADKSIFLNTVDFEGLFLDENIFKPLEKIISVKKKKKLIVIHLIGTHGDYANRYPENYNFFKEAPITNFNSTKAHKTINEYDNAVRYNDFIVNEIISTTQKTNSNSFVIYFSDHGEDVYETYNKSFHTEENGTKPMFDIPFLLWRSKKFKQNTSKNFIFDINRKYSTENLIYTLADLAKISFSEFLPEKSLVNEKFIEESRIIYNNKEYDEYFKNK